VRERKQTRILVKGEERDRNTRKLEKKMGILTGE
jgi:hypothetical protein